MKIIPWHDEAESLPEGLSQMATPRSQWPFAQDWIVDTLKYDRKAGFYWVSGVNLADDGKPFLWAMYTNRPLDWRFDLTAARFVIGAHYR